MCACQPEGGEGGDGDGDPRRNGEAQHPADEPRHVATQVGCQGEEERGHADREGVDDAEVARQEEVGHERDARGHCQQRRPDGLGNEQVGHPFDVGGDAPALGHHPRQAREAPVEQDQLGDGPGGRRAAAHGHAGVGQL